MGDFGRYVVEAGLQNFSRYRIGQDYSEHERRKPRFIKSRWKTFVASLDDEQKHALDSLLQNPEPGKVAQLSPFSYLSRDPLTVGQHELLNTVYVYPKPVNHEYPTAGARRWVFRRTLSLGWTPQLFGRQDGIIGHGQGWDGHKAERWGKKYQWMAYHELLARVADNYQSTRRFGESEPYEGLHQIIGEREIDPSLPPVDFRTLNESEGSGASAWGRPPIHLTEWPPGSLDFSRYRGNIRRFLADTGSEPTVAGSMFVRDRDGNDWVVLESSVKKVDPFADKGWRGLREQSGIDTLLIATDDAERFLAALSDEPRHEIRDLVDSQGHTDCCYIGEVGRVGPSCDHRHDQLQSAEIGNKCFCVVDAVEQYTWEGNIYDCSMNETSSTALPSTFIQHAAKLELDMRGPSWRDAAGEIVFSHYEEQDDDSCALLVKASFLREFLTAHKLVLIAMHWFERLEMSDNNYGAHPSVESSIDAFLSADLEVHEEAPRRVMRDFS